MLFIVAALLVLLIWTTNKLHDSGLVKVPRPIRNLLGTLKGVDEIIRTVQFTSVFFSGHLKIQSSFAIDHTGLLMTGRSAKIDAFANFNSKMRRLVRFQKSPGYVLDLNPLFRRVAQASSVLMAAELGCLLVSDFFNVLYFLADNYTSLFLFGFDIGKENELAADNFANWVWIISSFFAVLNNLCELYRAYTQTKSSQLSRLDIALVCFKNFVDTLCAACYIWPWITTRKIVGLLGMVIGTINISRLLK